MSFQLFGHLFVLLLSAAVMLGIGAYARRQRRVAGAGAFAICALLVALWTAGNAAELAVGDPRLKLFFANLQYISHTFLPVAWLAMVLQYTGRTGLLKWRRFRYVLLVPYLTNVLVWTNDLHGFIRTAVSVEKVDSIVVLAKTPGLWFWVHSGYSYGLLAIALWLLTASLFTVYPAHHGQILALMSGMLVPALASAIFVLGVALDSPFLRIDPAPAASGVTGMIIGWALFRYHLFVVVPLAHERIIAGLADGVIAADVDGRVVSLNPAAERLLGVPSAKASGRPLASVTAVAPAIAALGPGEVAVADLQVGAERRHVEARAVPLEDTSGRTVGQIVVLHDVTELRDAVESLTEAERRYRELTELLPLPVFELDAELRVTFANRALHDSTGYDASDLARGFAAVDLVAPADRERAEASIGALLGGVAVAVQEYEIVRKDGSAFPGEVHSSPVVRGGRVVGLRGVIVDLTERKAQEAAREEHLSLISHDLRNPITVAAGHAEWLQRRLADRGLGREAFSAEIALKSARQASAMIRELVDVARLEAGKLATRPVPVDVGEFVAEVVERSVPIEDRSRVRCEVAPDLLFALDPDRIERVLANLVGNALRHSPDGASVVVRAAREAGGLAVAVADRGEGIAAADLPHLFDRYYQSASRQASTEGLGLGLYIARLIVEAHGGEIAATSAPGEGATFRFRLPG